MLAAGPLSRGPGLQHGFEQHCSKGAGQEEVGGLTLPSDTLGPGDPERDMSGVRTPGPCSELAPLTPTPSAAHPSCAILSRSRLSVDLSSLLGEMGRVIAGPLTSQAGAGPS